MADCKLSQGTGGCTFKATRGAVTLSVEGTTGTVLFQKAKYNGADIPNLPAKTISFTIVAGTTDLDVVYSFSNPTGGAGVLKEVCTANTELMPVSAKEPSSVYHICA